MKKILITGGTVFVSRYIAEYYVAKGEEVYVINRGSRPQSTGVKLIQADRHELGDILKDYHFDLIIDTAYTARGVECLLDAIESFDDYVLISSSAVYPEYHPQPFAEEFDLGLNKYWGKYGTDKIEAESVLMERVHSAYILRPPYLYGQMNNVYREAFVFDCAMQGRKFYLPRNGEMKLQFFHIDDLCRFTDAITEVKPNQHIFNVGNSEAISVREWVELCYRVAGKQAEFVEVFEEVEQRSYFCFYDYEYFLDVSKQNAIMPDTKPMSEGLRESFKWYCVNREKVITKPFFEFIDGKLAK